MKALEFSSRVTKNVIPIPKEIQAEIEASGSKLLRVILLLDEGENDDWRQMTNKQFFSGYAAEDSIYDSYKNTD